jgi:glycosyltransferase involved in cell wall biosynthesis
MNIIISCYACNPYMGSEDGTGWNYILSAGKKHFVHVITKSSNEEYISRYIKDSGICTKNIHFYYVPRPLDKITLLPGRIKYLLWQKRALKTARKISEENRIDYIHHITWATCILPIKMHKLDVPLVYGPVGGGEKIPGSIRLKLNPLDRFKELVRVGLQKSSKYFLDNRLTFEKAKLILVATGETRSLIPKRYRYKTAIMPAVGIKAEDISEIRIRGPNAALRIIMVGRLLFWKGFDIGIRAVQKLIDAGEDVSLTIVGEGKKYKSLQRLVKGYEDRINLMGYVPHEEMINLYDKSDILLNCTLHDSGCIVILEAMGRGLPIICIDTGGPKVLTTCECAIKIKPDRYEYMVDKLSEAILKLKNNAELYNKLSAGALHRIASEFIYDDKYDRIISLISQIDLNSRTIILPGQKMAVTIADRTL